MSDSRADVVCIGTGGVGSATLFHLARRGIKVIGLDRFPPGHDRGSSHGRTRVIRLAYFEHPGYVPLLRRSFQLWDELEQLTERRLYRQTGLLEVGPPEGEIISGVRTAASQHGLTIENLDPGQLDERFRGFVTDEGSVAVYEPTAGFLNVEACVTAHVDEAVAAGAELRTGVTVTGWRTDGAGVVVDTDQGSIGADRLVVTAGAWATQLLTDLELPLTVLRKPLFWFDAEPVYDADSGCPLFFFETPTGTFYGFPAHGDQGLKVAQHSGGDGVADPLTLDRSLHTDDLDQITAFLGTHLPGVHTGRVAAHSVCMYTSTPDGHFVVDRHPDAPQVSFVAGLSGHGFKMAGVLGEIMANMAADQPVDPALGFLGSSRFR